VHSFPSCTALTKSSSEEKVEEEEEILSELDLSEDASVQKARDYIVQAMGFFHEGHLDKAAMRLRFAISVLEFVSHQALATVRLQQACLQDQELQSMMKLLVSSGEVDSTALCECGISNPIEEDVLAYKSEFSEKSDWRVEKDAMSDGENSEDASVAAFFSERSEVGAAAGRRVSKSSVGRVPTNLSDRRLSILSADRGAGKKASAREEDFMKEIVENCRCGKYLEAYRLLKELMHSSQQRGASAGEGISELRLLGGQSSRRSAMNMFLGDQMVRKLWTVRELIQRGMEREKESPLVNASGWSYSQSNNTYLHANYTFEFWVRRAKGAEREEDGPPTQLLWYARHENLPLRTIDLVSIFREVDLFKKDWVPKCKHLDIVRGGPQSLDAVYWHCHTQEVSFMANEDTVVQHMFIWPEVNSVVIVGRSPPADARIFEGFQMQPHKRNTAFMPNTVRTTYITPHPDNPGLCSLIMNGTRGFLFPDWMLNMTMMKHFLARNQVALMHNMLEGWSDQYEMYDQRIKRPESATFYAQVSNLSVSRRRSWLNSQDQ